MTDPQKVGVAVAKGISHMCYMWPQSITIKGYLGIGMPIFGAITSTPTGMIAPLTISEYDLGFGNFNSADSWTEGVAVSASIAKNNIAPGDILAQFNPNGIEYAVVVLKKETGTPKTVRVTQTILGLGLYAKIDANGNFITNNLGKKIILTNPSVTRQVPVTFPAETVWLKVASLKDGILSFWYLPVFPESFDKNQYKDQYKGISLGNSYSRVLKGGAFAGWYPF